MSSYNFTRPTKPNYFVNFLVKGYVFPAFLIAFVLATILSVIFQIDLFSQLTDENAKIFFIAFLVFFITVLTVYVCVSIKNHEVGMNDSVSFGYIFAGVFYFLFLIIYGEGLQYIDLTNIIISLSLVIFGIILMLLSSVYFTDDGDAEIKDKKCYLGETSKKFSFVGVLLASIVINFIFFIFLNIKHLFVDALIEKGYADAPDYFFTYFKTSVLDNKVLLGFAGVGVLFLLLYAVFSLNEKKVNALDLFIWGYIFNIPALIALIYLLGNNDDMMNYIVAGGITVLVIVFAIIRNKFYKKISLKKSTTCYFKKFFNVKNIFLAFGLSALLVTFINITDTSSILSVFTENDELNIYLGLVPFALVYVSCFVGVIFIAFSLIKSAIIIRKPLYDKSDNYILFNIAFGIFELVSLIVVEPSMDFVKIAIMASYIIVALDIAFLRRSETK